MLLLHDESGWVMIVMNLHGEICGVFHRYSVAVESVKMSLSDEGRTRLDFKVNPRNHFEVIVGNYDGEMGLIRKVPINLIGVGMTSF